MNRKKISNKKKVSIISHNFLNKKLQGKYYKLNDKDYSKIYSHLRIGIPIESYNSYIDEIERLPLGIGVLINPKKNVKKFLVNLTPFQNFDSEFFWAKNLLLRCSDSINDFVKLKKDYADFVFEGNYDSAFDTLDEIENRHGFSIWLFKAKISLKQLAFGLEEQKKYTNKLRSELTSGSLSRFLIHWISVRNEPATSSKKFKSQIQQILQKLNPTKQEGFKEFIEYHLLENDSLSAEELIHVVRISYSCSIIDYYESYIDLLARMTLEDKPVNKSKVLGFLEIAKNKIEDIHLNTLCRFYYDDLVYFEGDPSTVENYENLLRGRFEQVYDATNNELELGGNLIINIVINSYALAFKENDKKNLKNGNNKLKENVITLLSQIIEKGIIERTQKYNELNKLVLNFSNLYWIDSIKYVLAKENSFLQKRIQINGLEITSPNIIHPFFLEFIDRKDLYELYEEKCIQLYGNKLSLNYQNSLFNLKKFNCSEFNQTLIEYCNLFTTYHRGRYSEAINLAKNLKDKKVHNYYDRRILGYLSYSYFFNNDYKTTCELVGSEFVTNKNSHAFLPLQELSNILVTKSPEWRECKSLIDLPIFFDAYYKHFTHSEEIERYRKFAYEDFLFSMGVEKPSQLKPFISKLHKEKTVYYLRYICLESIMDTSGAFDNGSSEVLEERLQICKMLSEFDSTNKQDYEQEIREILRRQIITSRRKEVDQSKIYLDINSVKEKAQIDLEENYHRFINYKKVGLLDSFLNDGFDKSKGSTAFHTPDNESNELLSSMIEDIKSLYFYSDYGLDRFISTRIRHGDLERTMRVPIEKYNLITKKKTKNGPYIPNLYWLEKFHSNQESYDKINDVLNKFSEDFDNLILKITNELLQVKRHDKPLGLFEINFSKSEVIKISALVTAETTLKEFIDIIIKYLDNALLFILKNIRETLNNKIKQESKLLLTNLLDDTEELHVLNNELVRSIVQAKTDLNTQLDKIIEWFVPSAVGDSTPYTIEDALLVAEAILKDSSPQFEVEITKLDENEFSIHGNLLIFIDIFINCFENVIKRSGLEKPRVKIELSTHSINEGISKIDMEFTNELGKDIDIIAVQNILDEIKDKLEKNVYSKYVATEINSGLFKIYKSIMDFSVSDVNVKPNLDFRIYDNQFKLNISVPFNVFSLETDDENKIIENESIAS